MKSVSISKMNRASQSDLESFFEMYKLQFLIQIFFCTKYRSIGVFFFFYLKIFICLAVPELICLAVPDLSCSTQVLCFSMLNVQLQPENS